MALQPVRRCWRAGLGTRGDDEAAAPLGHNAVLAPQPGDPVPAAFDALGAQHPPSFERTTMSTMLSMHLLDMLQQTLISLDPRARPAIQPLVIS